MGLKLIYLIPLWIFQYGLIVPIVYLSVWTWRFLAAAVGFAFGLGLLGIVLLFVPVIGWVILLVILMSPSRSLARETLREARKQRRHVFNRRMLHPWKPGVHPSAPMVPATPAAT